MVKRFSIAVLMLLMAAPVLLSVRSANANGYVRVCYVGTGQFRYGIVLNVSSEDALRLVKKRRAYRNYECTGSYFQGYEICRPLKGGKF